MRLDDLLAEITMQAAWVSPGAAKRSLLRAAEALCKLTWVWQERLDAEVASSSSMPVEPWSPCHASIVAVRDVWADGSRLAPLTPQMLDGANTDFYVDPGTPWAFYCPQPGMLRLVPVPSTPVTLTIHAVLAPRITATELPDVLDKYADALIAGALSRAMLHPGAGERGPSLAPVFLGQFERGVSAAKRDAMSGHQGGHTTIEPHPLT